MSLVLRCHCDLINVQRPVERLGSDEASDRIVNDSDQEVFRATSLLKALDGGDWAIGNQEHAKFAEQRTSSDLQVRETADLMGSCRSNDQIRHAAILTDHQNPARLVHKRRPRVSGLAGAVHRKACRGREQFAGTREGAAEEPLDGEAEEEPDPSQRRVRRAGEPAKASHLCLGLTDGSVRMRPWPRAT